MVDLSERALISCNTSYLEFIMSTGLPPENCNPFVPFQNGGNPSPGWQLRTVRAGQHNWYQDLSIEEFKALLVSIGPIVTGMNVPQDFFNYVDGIYSKALGSYVGFHLVSVIGYDDLAKCFIVKNSWGQNWGNKGFSGLHTICLEEELVLNLVY